MADEDGTHTVWRMKSHGCVANGRRSCYNRCGRVGVQCGVSRAARNRRSVQWMLAIVALHTPKISPVDRLTIAAASRPVNARIYVAFKEDGSA